MTKRVAAADFKARCLELMDHVRDTGAEYIITKHGKPVAKLVQVPNGNPGIVRIDERDRAQIRAPL